MIDKETFWMELYLEGQIRIDPFKGLIWNNITSRYMGYISNAGYIALAWKYEGRAIHALAHRVIWWYCYGSIPDWLEVNHIDGNKQYNSIYNLELVTSSENNIHAIKNNLINVDNIRQSLREYYSYSRNKGAKLSEADVNEIKRFRKEDPKFYTYRKLGSMFGVAHTAIVGIFMGRKYRPLKCPEIKLMV